MKSFVNRIALACILLIFTPLTTIFAVTLAPTDDRWSGASDGQTTDLTYSKWTHAFMRYDVSSVTDIESATLRLYSTESTPLTVILWPGSSDNWNEDSGVPKAVGYPWTGVNPIASTSINTVGYFDVGITAFVTAEIAGDGFVTIEITNGHGTWHGMSSKEGEFPPELIIKGAATPTEAVLTHMSITPSTAQTLTGESLHFTAAGIDQNGNPFPINPAWQLSGGGTITQQGLFTATTAGGPFTVTVTDAAVTTAATVTITQPQINSAPTVNTGADRAVTIVPGGSIVLTASIADDGLPKNNPISTLWQQINGPGTVVFENPALPGARVFFQREGIYTLQISADDGELHASDTIKVDVVFGQSVSNLVINEFIASNVDGIIDPDDNSRDDWIEIHNKGSNRIDLTGYFLSDESDDPEKWQFPATTTIAANGYLLVWADKDDKGGAQPHTNFKLSASGEAVVLSSPTGNVIDQVNFAQQISDISYGRRPDGTGPWAFYPRPTPDAKNTGDTVAGQTQPPTFSLSSGFYNGSQQVRITAPANSQFAYTTDGSDPSPANGLHTQTNLTISSTSVIRAKAFREQYLNSNTITHTLFIDENPTIPVVSISSDPDGLYGSDNGIFVHFKKNWEREVNVEYFDHNKNLVVNQRAGLDIHGSGSRALPQKSVAIRARGRYGAKTFEYPFFDSKSNQQYTSLILRTSSQDQDRAHIRDAVIQGLVEDQMDVDLQAYQPVLMFINGQYQGVRNLREKVNKHYPDSNYGIDKGDVDLLDYTPWFGLQANSHYESMIEYIQSTDMNSQAALDYLNSQMDIDEYINYQMTQIYVGNTDWPGNNLKLWRDRSDPDSRWRWVLFGTEFGFKLWGGGTLEPDFNTLQFALVPNSGVKWPNPPESTLLFRKLMENPDFRNRFSQRLAGHINTTFSPQRVNSIIDNITQEVEAEMDRHFALWGTVHWLPNNRSEWLQYIEDQLKPYGQERPQYMRQYLLQEFYESSGYTNLNLTINNVNMGSIEVSSVKIPSVSSFTGKWLKDIPVTIKATPKDGFQFIHWQGASNSSQPDISITMAGNTELTAVFEEIQQDPVDLVFTEIHYNPEAGTDFEFLEIYNAGSTLVDMGGYAITSGIKFTFPDRFTLEPAGLVILTRDITRYNSLPVTAFEWDKGKLSNGGELLALSNAAGIIIDFVEYEDAGDWPTEADGNGSSLELISPNLDNSLAASWQASLISGGTPGSL